MVSGTFFQKLWLSLWWRFRFAGADQGDKNADVSKNELRQHVLSEVQMLYYTT